MSAASEQRQQALAVVKGTIGAYKGELIASLPTHLKEQGVGFMTSALAALRRNDTLLRYAMQDTGSLMTALSEAAQLGLMPGSPEYWLTPKAGKVLGIVGYEGEIELMYRAGAVASVVVEKVHENDVFIWKPGSMTKPQHDVDWFGGNRGKCIGAYAYAIMRDGVTISKVVIVDQERIARAKKASASASSDKDGPWETDEGAMILKTAAHDLAHWVPTSAEYRNEMIREQRELQTVPAAPIKPNAERHPDLRLVEEETKEAEEDAAEIMEDLGENEPNYPESWGGPGGEA